MGLFKVKGLTTLGDMAHGSITDEEIQPLITKSGKSKITRSRFGRFIARCFKEDEEEKTGISWLNCSLILANIVLGIGLLNFPRAMADAGGVWPALYIQAVCMIVIMGGLMLMALCSDLSGLDNYQDVVRYYGGVPLFIFCNVTIFIHNFGTCVTFLVIIGDQIDQVMFEFNSSFCHIWYMNRTFTVSVIATLMILPLLFSKRIDGFRFSSFLGIATMLYVLGLTAVKYFIQTHERSIPTTELSSGMTVSGIFMVVPTICFSFESHIEAIPLYACQKERNLWTFAKVILVSTLLSSFVYNALGAFGYLTFGYDVSSDVLLSYKPDAVVLVGMAMAALKAVTTYPTIFFCCRLSTDSLAELVKEKTSMKWTEKMQRNASTAILFVSSLVMALGFKTISSVISLLGGTGALFVMVFPGYCCMAAYKTPKTGKQLIMLIVGVVFIVVGVFASAVTFTQSGLRYSRSEFSETEVACY